MSKKIILRFLVVCFLVLILFMSLTGCSFWNSTRSGVHDPQIEPQKPSTPINDAPLPAGQIRQDSGRYGGQIDGNSIEIEISGVPTEIAARAFRFTEPTQQQFETLDLKTGEQVLISYQVNEYGQNMLTEIKRVPVSQ